jgi:hypothetical protein
MMRVLPALTICLACVIATGATAVASRSCKPLSHGAPCVAPMQLESDGPYQSSEGGGSRYLSIHFGTSAYYEKGYDNADLKVSTPISWRASGRAVIGKVYEVVDEGTVELLNKPSVGGQIPEERHSHVVYKPLKSGTRSGSASVRLPSSIGATCPPVGRSADPPGGRIFCSRGLEGPTLRILVEARL